jgi:hypothetical protein
MSAEAEDLSTKIDFCAKNSLVNSEQKLQNAVAAHKAAILQGREVLGRVAYATTRAKVQALITFHEGCVDRLEKQVRKAA